ncbi:helix-turn-helix domain-containing protein [Wenyingzhuangia sp. 2_MG-2023]|uniref:helix-turn-helix domain-containing protein n=1 Tax=Wenyingzhuangia sp. 2_MG-2023 TaxID=3062639 RepID=UPI0026E2D483|nr:helix-turn-helix transcriptional regulator [Wenyingzhuangia sp. 2_MG-2023]MDO6736906.1 helix-turn-helix transcriptional regulator [Wenyingzhuangia sp. 2_MG-2023]
MSFFGRNVKKIRGIKKMSQQSFADLFSLKRATLGAYEEGRSEPKIDTIVKVANYFSISIDDILTKEITVNQLLSFDGGITTDLNQVVRSSFVEIPFVTHLNKSLFVADFTHSQTYDFLPKIKIPTTDDKDVLAFVVDDLVMVHQQEGLFPGDVVIGKRVLLEDVKTGEVVLVLTQETMFVRRFSKTETHYMFLADQINVAPIEVTLETDVYLWKVTEVILKRYPQFVSDLENKVNQIINKLND